MIKFDRKIITCSTVIFTTWDEKFEVDLSHNREVTERTRFLLQPAARVFFSSHVNWVASNLNHSLNKVTNANFILACT